MTACIQSSWADENGATGANQSFICSSGVTQTIDDSPPRGLERAAEKAVEERTGDVVRKRVGDAEYHIEDMLIQDDEDSVLEWYDEDWVDCSGRTLMLPQPGETDGVLGAKASGS